MQVSTAAILTFFLVASVASANSGQQDQQPGLVSSVVSSVSDQSQSVPVSAPASQSAPVEVSAPASSPVVSEQQAPQQVVASHHNHHPSVASYYASGSGSPIQMAGGEQQLGNNKPVQAVRNFEQYGQPESASIPPNYKPFGSWGLYIGGNPADGYYTNYYKSVGSNSVDKQVAGDYVKPVASQTAAFAPILRQASSSPYTGSEYYPVAYSPAELSSSRLNSEPQFVHHAVAAVAHPQSSPVSPVQAGAQVHGVPATFDSNYASVSSYADAYATKRLGGAGSGGYAPVKGANEQRDTQLQLPAKGYEQKEAQLPAKGYEQKEVQLPAKGYQYQARAYSYPVAPLSAPLERSQFQAPSNALAPANQQPQQQQQQQQHQQVVAYAVPVGSQIVGSQAGVEGAFTPYGVHAFTRYAVKPTILNQDQSYYYSLYSPYVQAPAYKHSAVYSTVQQQQQQPLYASYPFSYYGYPLNHLHYSQSPQYQYQALPAPQFAPVLPSVPQQAAPEYTYQPYQYEQAAPAPAAAPAAFAPSSAPAAPLQEKYSAPAQEKYSAPAQEKYEAPEPKYGVKTAM